MISINNSLLKTGMLLLSMLGMLSACSGGSSPPEIVSPTENKTISGSATKGSLIRAQVDFFEIDSQGTPISSIPIVTTTTDDFGHFTVTVPSNTGALLVKTFGGTYIDESDQNPDINLKRRVTFSSSQGLETVMPVNQSTVAITIASQALYEKAKSETQNGNFLAVYEANRQLAILAYGFDPITTQPADTITPDPGSSSSSKQYALVLGGIANIVNSASLELGEANPTFEIIMATIQDLSDGILDGTRNGDLISVTSQGSTVFYPNDLDLNEAINRFRNNNFSSFSSVALVIVDQALLSTGDTSPNVLPIANAGNDQLVDEGMVVNLSGTASADPDGTIVSYSWVQIGSPTVTLNNAATATPSFTAPSTNSVITLTFQLTVTDDQGATASDTVVITVNPLANTPPIANAGNDQSVDEGSLVNLSGTASSDPDGTIVSYSWVQIGSPTVTLNNAATATPSFTAPTISNVVALTFTLTVTDDQGASDSDNVVITVNPIPPTVNAGTDTTVVGESLVQLSGSGIADDGTAVTFFWTQISGSPVTLSDPNLASPVFTAPQVVNTGSSTPDVLAFELMATDSAGISATDSVIITVTPNKTLLSLVIFPDSVIDNCVQTTAASNSWTLIEEVISLTCSSSGITSLVGIEQLTNLQLLSLGVSSASTSSLTDITPLNTLNLLTSLTLKGSMVTDLSPINALLNLLTLDLTANQIVDLTPISGLTNLRDLNIANNQISDISLLSSLGNLNRLILSTNLLTDISVLSNLQMLTQLKIENNSINDMSPISALPLLNTFDASGNQIASILSLPNSNALSWLDLSNNLITDISSLSSHPGLIFLDLSNNSISDISVYTTLTNLTAALLSFNSITDVSALFNLANLTDIQLLGNNMIPCAQLDTIRANFPTASLGLPTVCETRGSVKWLFNTGGAVNSSPAIGRDGSIYFGSDDGNLYKLDSSGTEVWRFSTSGAIQGDPAIVNSNGLDSVFFGSADGRVYVRGEDNLSGCGTSPLVSGVSNSIAVDEFLQRFYVSSSNSLYQFDFSCNLISVFTTPPGNMTTAAVTSEGMVFVGSEDGFIYGVTFLGTSPNVAFNFATSSMPNHSAPILQPNGNIIVGSDDNNMYNLLGTQPPLLTTLWIFPTTQPIESSAIIAPDGTVLFGSNDKNLYAVSSSGVEKWKITTSGAVTSTPAVGASGNVYFASQDNFLYASDSAGNVLWSLNLNAPILSSPVLLSDGSLLIGSQDGNLYSVFTQSGGLATTDWPMKGRDIKHRNSLAVP